MVHGSHCGSLASVKAITDDVIVCNFLGEGCINRRDSHNFTTLMATEAINLARTSNTKDLVDLEAITLNWAKQIFEVTKTRDEAKISKKYLQAYKLNAITAVLAGCFWDSMRTVFSEEREIAEREEIEEQSMSCEYNINWSHAFNECLEPRYSIYGVDINSTKRPKSEQVLFKSTFTNSTDREQEYSFKTERSTRSTVTVSVEKGVCRGVDMELKLKTPCEIAEANAGFRNEVSVVHIGENCIEEELSWGVDSTVRVPPMCETVAQLVIVEDHHTRNFSVECRLSGKVIVTVTNLKENNSLVTIIEGKIADIIRGLPNCSALGFVIKNDVVTYTTKGSCKFRYGIEQIVKISEHAILPSMLRRY
uniref:Uncharacterized protein n=1 Tax=Parascaris univalens TaxID=6257 RepID=A0A915BAW8_PARUN